MLRDIYEAKLHECPATVAWQLCVVIGISEPNKMGASSCDSIHFAVRHQARWTSKKNYRSRLKRTRLKFVWLWCIFVCCNLVTECLSYVAVCSQFIYNSFAMLSRSFLSRIGLKLISQVANSSQSCHMFCTFWLMETQLRRVPDGFETPATTLCLFWEKICRAKSLNVQNSSDRGTRLCGSLENKEKPYESLENLSRMLFAICRQQSHLIEIGALEVICVYIKVTYESTH